MQQDEKVDLTSVNKTKKQLKFPAIKNPFKKQVGPKRDDVGKFTSGSGGLLSGKKFNLKRAVPLVAVVALVGGFFVYRSFAAVTKPPAYQYSMATCKSTSNKPAKDTTCQDQSAEAMVYRLYKGAFGRNPDQNGYKQHTQMLAGDRIKRENVASAFVNSQEFKNLKISSNKVFVERLFKNMLKRGNTYTAAANDTWVKSLDTKKMSRATVLTLIAQSQEAQSKTRADFLKYSGSAPKFGIVQTAQQKQTARNKESAQYVTKAKIHYEGALGQLKQANSFASKAKSQASAKTQNSSTLANINSLKSQAQKSLQNAQSSAKNSNAYLVKAEAMLKTARSVSQYSPDIPSSSVESARNQTAIYAAQAKNKANDINAVINSISSQYNIAKAKIPAPKSPSSTAIGKGGTGSAGGTGGGAAPVAQASPGPCANQNSQACKDALAASFAPSGDNSKGRKCPERYFSRDSDKSCWSNVAHYQLKGKSCAADFQGYTYYSTLDRDTTVCRKKKPQYGGY